MTIPILILFVLVAAALVALVLRLSSQVNDRLEYMTRTLQDSQKAIGANLASATGVFGSVQEKLGRLEETNRQIVEISRDITSLQDLLRAPKFRGAMGETLLENLLSQILPTAHYRIQHRFKSGDIVDAAIVIGDRLVCVDAKFSLENFQKMVETKEEAPAAVFRRKFMQDMRTRTDEISSKYILPQEQTYDFALMYVPAENVYYEAVVKEDILAYCLSKRVIPVSPNTLYAYLQVICLGLKGLKVEENAREILNQMRMLSTEMGKFRDDFSVLGGHLASASKKYDESQRRLEKFTDKLSTLQDAKQIPEG